MNSVVNNDILYIPYIMAAISNFHENSRRYSKVKVNHQCQRHRQKMKTILGYEVLSYFVEMLLGCWFTLT
jgi:hypothetical protein